MTTIRRNGRFAPSRFYLPLSRLIGFVLMRARRDEVGPYRYSYTYHDEQSRVEAPFIAVYIAFFTYAFWIALLRTNGAGWVVTLTVTALVGTLQWSLWVAGFGVLISLIAGWSGNRLKLQTAAATILTIGMSVYMIGRGGVYAAMAAVWLSFVALNILAWPITFALRGAILHEEAQLER